MPKTVDTVERERERERERVYSREISFICHAQKTVLVGIEIIDFNRIHIEKRMDYIAKKNCYIVCPFCVFYKFE